MRAEGIADVSAALLVQGFVVVDSVAVELERGTVFACQALGDQNLVEEIPLSPVAEGADPAAVKPVRGVEHLAWLQLGVVVGHRRVHHFHHAFVLGVVVQVSHHNDLGFRIDGQQAVHHRAGQASGHLPLRGTPLFPAQTGRPVVDNDMDRVAHVETRYQKLVTGLEAGIRRVVQAG